MNSSNQMRRIVRLSFFFHIPNIILSFSSESCYQQLLQVVSLLCGGRSLLVRWPATFSTVGFFHLFVSFPFDVHFGRGKWYLVRLFLCNPARLESNGEERREVRDFRPSVRLDWPADVVAASLSWSVCPVWFLFSMTNVSFHRLFRLRWQNRCRQRSSLVDFLRHSIGSCAGRIGNFIARRTIQPTLFLVLLCSIQGESAIELEYHHRQPTVPAFFLFTATATAASCFLELLIDFLSSSLLSFLLSYIMFFSDVCRCLFVLTEIHVFS